MLKDAAELAAMTSKFKPLEINGRAVRYDGILLYSFVVNHVNWYGFGTALESTRQFDNISFGPAAQILSNDFAKEKARLVALDADGGADFDARAFGLSNSAADRIGPEGLCADLCEWIGRLQNGWLDNG